MFKKKKTQEKSVKPIPEQVEPGQIEELEEVEETVVPENPVVEKPKEEPQTKEPVAAKEEVEPELTEEKVMENFRNIATVLSAQDTRLARIEHHLRIDFD